MIKKVLIAILSASCFLYADAQTGKQINIQTNDVSLLLTVGQTGRLYQSYFGKKLLNKADYAALPVGKHEAYITGGMEDQFQPAIKVTHADGNPSLVLQYVSDEQHKTDKGVEETIIRLKDPKYAVEVDLHYQTFDKDNVIKAWTDIRNNEKGALTLTAYASNMLHLEASKYWLTQFHGDWAGEMQQQESQLTSGSKVIDSKLGTRADEFSAPVFMLSLGKRADETSGDVLAATLAWTGNFSLQFEIDQVNDLRIISGINPYASEYHLASGKTFTTPELIITYSTTGKGQASRNLHSWARSYGVLDGEKPRMALLNNWETTGFKFDEDVLVKMLDDTKTLGVPLFLLDDGWFGNKYPRNNDKAGLGDWDENKAKLPHNIEYLVKQAEAKGVKFGIWIEPEMVNPKSELYEKHPEWILKLANRDENYQRNQLILDLTNPKVQDYVYGIVDNMMTKNPGIAYIKWDCNRTMSNTYSAYLKDKQSQVYVDYVLGLYKVFERMRQKYPHLPIMLCSGGGGRTDYGALKYFTEFWPSDNTDPMERIYIQWGYSNFFPANTIANHITSWNKTATLKFRTDMAMMDRMGYDINVSKMTPEELKFSQKAVETYTRLTPVIWQGDLYRLISPYDENRAVLMYVNEKKDKAVFFNYVLNKRYREVFTKVKLQGLDPQKRYKVQEVNIPEGGKAVIPENGKTLSGDYLMTVGISPANDRKGMTSNVLELTAQ